MTRYGTTGAIVSESQRTYTGYSYDATYPGTLTSAPIAGNGSTHLKLYYRANTYTVSFNKNAANATNPSPASKPVVYDTAYGTLPVISRPGYTFEGWWTAAAAGTPVQAGTIVSTAVNHTLFAHWSAKADTPYKVEHYLVDAWNVATLKNTDNLMGVTDTLAAYSGKTYPGYTLKLSDPRTVIGLNIAGNGSTVIKLYYAPNPNTPYQVSHLKSVEGAITPERTQTRTGITTSIVSEAPISIAGYTYAPTYPGTLTSASIAGDGSTHLKLFYKANPNTPYKVEHYKVEQDFSATLQATENLTGMTDTLAQYTLRSYPGYALDLNHPDSTAGATINGDGSTVIRLYYVVTFDVAFVDWDDTVISKQEIILGYDAEEPTAPQRYGYMFFEWDGDWHNVDSNRRVTAVYIPAWWSGSSPVPSTPGAAGSRMLPDFDFESDFIAGEEEAAEAVIETVPEIKTPEAAKPAEIADKETPVASSGSWALINLLLTLATLVLMLLMLAMYFMGRSNDAERINRHLAMRLLTIVIAAAAIMLFVLTQDLSASMTMVDGFTLWHVGILAVQIIFAMLARKSFVSEEEEA
jgi:uncharacterized repeat protein (TIGR02543 family)